MILDPQLYRKAIARFATGVTIISTRTTDGAAGMTASAVCSLSLEPVQLLVCISKHLPTHKALEDSGSFAVNVLGEGHAWLARRFARPNPDKFAGLALHTEHDVPVLSDAIAYFVCDVAECLPGGDHSIFIGNVTACGVDEHSAPLLYFGSDFSALEAPESRLLSSYLTAG